MCFMGRGLFSYLYPPFFWQLGTYRPIWDWGPIIGVNGVNWGLLGGGGRDKGS